jgi:hypothetical protein
MVLVIPGRRDLSAEARCAKAEAASPESIAPPQRPEK